VNYLSKNIKTITTMDMANTLTTCSRAICSQSLDHW